jgi:Putative DNA-binding domain
VVHVCVGCGAEFLSDNLYAMIWEGKRLRDITEADLRAVLESEMEEHKHLDYKAELYTNNDAGQKDFLTDVCAFANAEGGILLIGVPEVRDPGNGQPTGAPDLSKLEGIDTSNPESLLISYDSRVVSGIEERLSLETQPIKLGNGKYVLAIRVPNSLNKPHCVRRDDKRYFPSRRDRHIYYMDVQEIKEVVMRTASRQEQAEQLLLEALKEVQVQTDRPYLILGTIPIFGKEFLVDLRDQAILGAMRGFDVIGGPSFENCDFSFNGLERRTGKYHAVAQLRRNGLVRHSQQIPTMNTTDISGFFPTAVDGVLRRFIQRVAELYNVAGLSGPFLLGMMITANAQWSGLYPDQVVPQATVVRGNIQPGPHAFPVMTSYDFGDIDPIMRPLCDQVHQTFGEEGSPSFDSNGKWIEHS